MSGLALPQRDTYWRQWAVTLVLILGGWFTYLHMTRPAPVPQMPAASIDAKADHYLILRMPAITSQYESGIETMRVRYGEWLKALTAAGFRPLLFSELRRLNADGAPVPPKSVVLMFDPGFRRTYNIVAPILRENQWNAVWMSDENAMKHRHREYITFHTARQMVSTGGWDVGLKRADGTYVFDVGQEDKFILGQRRQGTWVSTSGGLALNSRNSFYALNSLSVNADWLPQDLVNRLEAELPVQGPVYFTLGEVQNLTWGMTSATPESFNLAAEPQQRSAIVSWLGTRGLDNARIRIKGKDLAGTLSMRLRWDEITSSGIQISMTNGKVTAQEWRNGESRAIFKVNRNSSDVFIVNALLVGDHLAVSVDGGPTTSIPTPIAAGNGNGVAQVYLQDGVLGAARVNDVQIFFTPLPQSAVVFSTGG